MWQGETIFSGGDLSSGIKWVTFMMREYSVVDEESAAEAVRDRKDHIKSCIERLQDELAMMDQLETLLPCGCDCQECDATEYECPHLYAKNHPKESCGATGKECYHGRNATV